MLSDFTSVLGVSRDKGDAAHLQIEYVLKMNNFRNGDGGILASTSELCVVLLTSGRHARAIFRPTPPDLPKPK